MSRTICNECGRDCQCVIRTEPGYHSEAWGARMWHPPVDYVASDCCDGEVIDQNGVTVKPEDVQ